MLASHQHTNRDSLRYEGIIEGNRVEFNSFVLGSSLSVDHTAPFRFNRSYHCSGFIGFTAVALYCLAAPYGVGCLPPQYLTNNASLEEEEEEGR